MATPPARKKAAPPKKAPANTKPAAPAKKRAGSVTPATNASKPTAPKKPAAPAPRTKRIVPRDAKGTKPDVSTDAVGTTLNPRAQRFVDEYLVDLNGTQAAIRAGYSARTAQEQASRLLSIVMVQDAVTAGRRAQQERTQVSADKVVLEAWNIATADPRKLVEVKVGCCRHCWGEGHRRQRTLSEYNADRETFREGGKPPEDWEEEGGIGYTPLRDAHPACPECHGDGCPRVVLGDTRRMSQEALALYAGARQTKFGIEVLMHDKSAALEKLFKHLGLYEKDNQQKTDPLASLLHAIAAGNSNGFAPKAVDPEKPVQEVKPNAFMPKADPEADPDWRG